MSLVLIALPLSVQARQLRIETIESPAVRLFDRERAADGHHVRDRGNRSRKRPACLRECRRPVCGTVFDLERAIAISSSAHQ